MKVVVAIDSFKGSLTSLQTGKAMREGIHRCKDVDVSIFPLSDGGEGFVDSYLYHKEYEIQTVHVHDAMQKMIECQYAIFKQTTAVMEMASMCGIMHINKDKNDIYHASTFGLGEMMIDALNKGCRTFVIGIGGSGTNDGGSGLLMALGYDLLDEDGKSIPFGAYGLSKLHVIKDKHVDKRLKECHFIIACDVENPILGVHGCSAVFGPQKGAVTLMVKEMDAWLSTYVHIIENYVQHVDVMAKGGGAAGGLGFAFLHLLHAQLKAGIQFISENVELNKAIKESDIVITGEGCLDAQTVMGKAPYGIAKVAKQYQKPVIAFSGSIGDDARINNVNGIDAYFSIQQKPCTLEEALDTDTAYQNLADTAEQVFRLWQTVSNIF